MIPVLLRLGPITVYSYGLMMALGFVAADIVAAKECRRRDYPVDFASSLVLWGAIGGLAGARIYDVLNNLPAYLADPWAIIWSGSGFVWYGGLIGGVVATWLVARHYKIGFLSTADLCAPALALGQAIGRMGCLLSGDGDWGLPSTLPWAMSFPHAIVGWNAQTVLKLNAHDQLVSGFFPGVRVHPTPIYESILYVMVFGILWAMRKKSSFKGQMLYIFMMLDGASRFAVEFLRINPRVWMGLSEAQIISVIMMVIGAAAYVYSSTGARASQHQQAAHA